MERFGLADARVGTPNGGPAQALQLVGRLAADLFGERIGQMNRVGLSWGSTLEAFVAEVPERVRGAAGAAVGRRQSRLDSAGAGGTLVQALARRCGVEPSRFLAPAIVESPQTKAAITSESAIRKALERAAQVDHAFVGIGTVGVRSSATIVEDMRLSDDELATFLGARSRPVT